MSAYIAIPARGSKGSQQQRQQQQQRQEQDLDGGQASGSSSSSSSMASSYSSSLNSTSLSLQMPPPTRASSTSYHYRRPSLLSSSISKQEHTVVDVGHPDGPPRLITCVKASQGFDWNQEIFLPSRSDHDSPLETRRDPVHEILLTDSEIKSMFPQ